MTTAVYESAELAELDRAQQLGRWERLGYEALNDPRGLPAALVDQARAAIAAERQAQAAYDAKTKQARDDIARMGLSGVAAEYHIQITRGEAWAALDKAQRALHPAVGKLGQVAEQVRAARETIGSAPAKRAQIEAECAQLLAALDQQEQAARQALASLGATE